MKKLVNYTLCALATILIAASCSMKVEDAFDESSSERVDAFTQKIVDVLQAAPNGWQAQYYAGTTYGGYNVFMKF